MADLGLPEEVATQVSVVQEVTTTRFKINKISLIFFKLTFVKTRYTIIIMFMFGLFLAVTVTYIHTYIHTFFITQF